MLTQLARLAQKLPTRTTRLGYLAQCHGNNVSPEIYYQPSRYKNTNRDNVLLEPNSIRSTDKLQLFDICDNQTIAQFRLLNDDGSVNWHDVEDEILNEEKLIELYQGMVKLNVFDQIMYECQRQGRISFYMTHFGEEAALFGSSEALIFEDVIFAQYREAGILLHRGMSFASMISQCFGNCDDLGKGRQMPIHYGNRKLNYVTISSPLATQMPQAVGAAYAIKRSKENRVVVCYFGEGAASEGDAHAAFNFAATLDCPVIFFCRNNGYAISTPAREQYRGDGLLARALGCGISAIRVDGNDLMAVYAATKRARKYSIENNKPILVEAMTYRVGHHSTSDDSSAYRTNEELGKWRRPEIDPIIRVKNYLYSCQLWNDDRDRQLRQETRTSVLDALRECELRPKLPIRTMFEDVYDEMPRNLEEQLKSLERHLKKFGSEYPLKEYQDG